MSNVISNLVKSSFIADRRPHGGLLLAGNPTNPVDFLYKGVVLLFRQSINSVIGLQLNRCLNEICLANIVSNMGLPFDSMGKSIYSRKVYFGGSVNTNRLHFVHSLDWMGLTTQVVGKNVGVTSDISVLTALVAGQGPKKYRACAGSWCWDIDTLKHQIYNLDPNYETQDHLWEVAPVAGNLVFDCEGSSQWGRVLRQSGRFQIDCWMN
jgi:putative AlgH/UPF0301 family transcriptional regulator